MGATDVCPLVPISDITLEEAAEWARRLAEGLATLDGIEVMHAVDLNVVTFALRDGDAARRDRFIAALAADGRVFMTPTVLFGRPAVRAAIANWSTREADVDLALAAVRDVLATA